MALWTGMICGVDIVCHFSVERSATYVDTDDRLISVCLAGNVVVWNFTS